MTPDDIRTLASLVAVLLGVGSVVIGIAYAKRDSKAGLDKATQLAAPVEKHKIEIAVLRTQIEQLEDKLDKFEDLQNKILDSVNKLHRTFSGRFK